VARLGLYSVYPFFYPGPVTLAAALTGVPGGFLTNGSDISPLVAVWVFPPAVAGDSFFYTSVAKPVPAANFPYGFAVESDRV